MTTMTTVTIRIDYENHAEMWWDAARAKRARPVPRVVRPLLTLNGPDAVSATPAEARLVRSWASRLTGWAVGSPHAPHPLRFEPEG